jgi:hypothetical protein
MTERREADMSEALHCDNPSCTNWVKKGGTHEFITINKKYKYYHVCTWVCLQAFSESFDPIDGPDDDS